MSFHVPEQARLTHHPVLGTDSTDGNNGAFVIDSPEHGWQLMLICSDSTDPDSGDYPRWEHVSVHALKGSRQDLTPNWREMCHVKNLCWDDEDVVMQLHPRKSEYVNCHPHTLHLWRPLDATIPEPPAIFVGPTS